MDAIFQIASREENNEDSWKFGPKIKVILNNTNSPVGQISHVYFSFLYPPTIDTFIIETDRFPNLTLYLNCNEASTFPKKYPAKLGTPNPLVVRL